MEFAQVALNQTLSYYIVLALFILLLIIIGIICLCKGGGNEVAITTLGLIVAFLIFVFVSIIPFMKDYFEQQIIVVEGVYNNAGVINGRSSAAGRYTVTIDTDDETISLTTAPRSKEIFVAGVYQVVAYYVPHSKTLLYIEVLEEVKRE